MIEFTMSRMALMICGLVMFSAAAIPAADFIDSGSDTDLYGLAEKDAAVIDAFWQSGADELILHGEAMIPSPGYRLEMDGKLLIIHSPEGREYTAPVKYDCGSFTLGYGEERILQKS